MDSVILALQGYGEVAGLHGSATAKQTQNLGKTLNEPPPKKEEGRMTHAGQPIMLIGWQVAYSRSILQIKLAPVARVLSISLGIGSNSTYRVFHAQNS